MTDLGLDFATTDAQLAEVPKSPVVKTCTCCARTYSRVRWEKLDFVGVQHVPAEEGPSSGHVYPALTLELRSCRCGSTVALAVTP